MIVTTTVSVEGRRITEYKGIVFGEVISGVNFVRDVAASFSNFFGGRSGSYEEDACLGETERPEGDGTACGRFGGQCGCRR